MVTIPYALSKADGSRAHAQSFTGEPKISARRTRQSGRGRSAFPVANPDRYRLPPGKRPLGGRGSVPPGADMRPRSSQPVPLQPNPPALPREKGRRADGGGNRPSSSPPDPEKAPPVRFPDQSIEAPTPHIRPRTILRLFGSRTDFFRT